MKKHFMAIALCLVCAIYIVSCGGNIGDANLCNNAGNTFENVPEKEVVRKIEYYIQQIYSSPTEIYPPFYDEEAGEKNQVRINTAQHEYLVQPYSGGVAVSRVDGYKMGNEELYSILSDVYNLDERVLWIDFKNRYSREYTSYIQIILITKSRFDERGEYDIQLAEEEAKRTVLGVDERNQIETSEQLAESRKAARLRIQKLKKFKREHY